LRKENRHRFAHGGSVAGSRGLIENCRR
jgi:hypothetical protein